ncbi:hypothetical protein FK535_06305 [Mycolicibacterium sp. 018/SC-01/001]|uniref:hypothetical protein n=1 Tax=Mycolicibacterium sp. 018/SC-01/001 TaxID=2592069 RepID=UPI00117E5B05|nr:hypothetical protein [Mycolicibacterium sp. 018/SC-01/001]TRW88032.1 hypothetical protein FK535_06305 [Mycolicibacterium sp. 018/SC-01/001]
MGDDEKTRWAIDVMTAWTEDDCAFYQQRVHTYLAEPHGDTGLITGLVNLTGLLLSGMEVTTGKTPAEILSAIASTIARHSPPSGHPDN